jgi:hypothetical protein
MKHLLELESEWDCICQCHVRPLGYGSVCTSDPNVYAHRVHICRN